MELNIARRESNDRSPYRQLHGDQIRILVLKAGLSRTPLEASLQVVSLSELPDRVYKAIDRIGKGDPQAEITHFEAISYCWGDAVFPRICKFTGGGKVSLTESLHSALQAFRYPDRSRSLWADAICINQADVAERSSQVELMGDIFTKASRVLVWLGEPLSSGSDTLAFSTLNMPIVPQGDRSRKDLLALLEQHLPGTKRCACCNETISPEIPVSLASGLSAVAKLLERPFFNRLWVVQEIVFAQSVEVHCGTHHANWEVFTELSRVPGQYQGDQEYDDHRYATTTPRSRLRQVWAQCNYLNQLRTRHRQRKTDIFRPTELCKDLLMMSNLQCRSPHDRIFGVSRVLGLREVSGLRADYSLTVAEVYRRVAEVYITAQANRPGGHAALLLALTSTETPEAKLLHRPSWVPDLQHLSERSRAKNTYYQWAFAERQFYADAAMFRCYISSAIPQELCIRGRCFGEITAILEDSQCPSKHVHRRSGERCSNEEGVQLVRWHARCREFLKQCAYFDSASDDLAEEKLDCVFSCDRIKDSAYLHVDTILEWLPDEKNTLEVQCIYRQLKPYITGYPVDRNRVLCTADCKSGLAAGWVPSDAQIGDRLCQFTGSPYPFLLRPREDGSYCIMGDAFLAGVSEPEALGLDKVEWRYLVNCVKRCDSALKTWLQSDDRKLLKEKRTNDGSDLGKADERMKSARQNSIDRLTDLYRKGDENLQWISLR